MWGPKRTFRIDHKHTQTQVQWSSCCDAGGWAKTQSCEAQKDKQTKCYRYLATKNKTIWGVRYLICQLIRRFQSFKINSEGNGEYETYLENAIILKNGYPWPPFHLISSFPNNLQTINCRLCKDLNFNCWSGRQAWWPVNQIFHIPFS